PDGRHRAAPEYGPQKRRNNRPRYDLIPHPQHSAGNNFQAKQWASLRQTVRRQNKLPDPLVPRAQEGSDFQHPDSLPPGRGNRWDWAWASPASSSTFG